MGKSTFKTWAPVIALVILAVSTITRLAGNGDLANTIDAVGATVGINEQSPVPAKEVAGTLGLLWSSYLGLAGAYRKLKAWRASCSGVPAKG